MIRDITYHNEPERLIFWGSTNSSDVQAAQEISHQYQQCLNLIGVNGTIVGFFGEYLNPQTKPIHLATKGLGGSYSFDGDWNELVKTVSRHDNDATAVICYGAANMSRRVHTFLDRLRVLHKHNISLIIASNAPTCQRVNPGKGIPISLQLQLGFHLLDESNTPRAHNSKH